MHIGKKLLLLTSLCILFSQEAFALTPLRPSLSLQMKKQEALNKENKISERKYANLMRLAEIRAKKGIHSNQSSTPAKSVIASATTNSPPTPLGTNDNHITGVDMSRVRSSWFSWYNMTRSSLGLSPYTYDTRLDVTARDWNKEFAKGKGLNHHTRTPGDGYYNFPAIDAWFIARGIDPVVIDRSKHTENVGYGYYNCSESDCTDELISSIRTTFDFFMSEKGKSYDAHYRSIVNPYFTKMGFDIIVVPTEKRYYITIHYVTIF